MLSKKIKSLIIFNLILLISFSISVNSFQEIKIINIIFYILFHMTFIYYLFYHYNFYLYFLAFFYGIFFDILFLNQIGSHLFCLILLISIYVLIKKYLLLLSSFQISLLIFIVLIATLFFEVIFAFLINNIYFTISTMIKYIVISMIIFFPSIIIFNKIDK